MTPAALLDTLNRLGAKVTPCGDRLRVQAPAGKLTPDLRRELAEHKADLLAWYDADRWARSAVARIEALSELRAELRERFEYRAAILQHDSGCTERLTPAPKQTCWLTWSCRRRCGGLRIPGSSGKKAGMTDPVQGSAADVAGQHTGPEPASDHQLFDNGPDPAGWAKA